MFISRIILKNWRNFRTVDQRLGCRAFLVGPAASGKTNFLDALAFLRDVASSGSGGLPAAVAHRQGIPKIRCLSARKETTVRVDVTLSDEASGQPVWRYDLGIGLIADCPSEPIVLHERAWHAGTWLMDRPDDDDAQDPVRLRHTHLEQVVANHAFRDIAAFLASIRVANPLPLMMRDAKAHPGIVTRRTNWGHGFFDRLLRTPERTRRARLKRIEEALILADPHLKRLTDAITEQGFPHLEAMYHHWRPNAGKQDERQFSDGTLRLIFLLWSVQEGPSPLLMEEPEQSLHAGAVRRIPHFLDRVQGKPKTQLFLSTHSADLVSEAPVDEVLLFIPEREGTRVVPATTHRGIRTLLELGHPSHDAPVTLPETVSRDQLDLFEG